MYESGRYNVERLEDNRGHKERRTEDGYWKFGKEAKTQPDKQVEVSELSEVKRKTCNLNRPQGVIYALRSHETSLFDRRNLFLIRQAGRYTHFSQTVLPRWKN